MGLGILVTSFATADNHLPALIGFGGLCGIGMGLGYASATPAAIKWFPSSMKGRVTGVVVAGMGLAASYLAPLSNLLITNYGINQAFWTLGIGLTMLMSTPTTPRALPLSIMGTDTVTINLWMVSSVYAVKAGVWFLKLSA